MKGIHLMIIWSLAVAMIEVVAKTSNIIFPILAIAPWVLWLIGVINPTTGFEEE